MPFDGSQKTEQQENLDLLCDFLEKTEFFLMSAYASCGTPACIAGHAASLWPDIRDRDHNPRELVPDFDKFALKIGVDEEPLSGLCIAWEHVDYGGIPTREITPKMAVAALRRLQETGEAYFSRDDR